MSRSKRVIRAALIAWTGAWGLCTTVCVAAGAGTERAGAADAARATGGAGAAESAEQQFIEAMIQSPQAMAPLLADDFVYLTTAGSAIGKQALLAHLRSGRTVVLQARREPGHLIERDGMVISSGVLSVTVRQDGAERDIRSRYLHVWARTGASGAWQLLARQATELAPGPR